MLRFLTTALLMIAVAPATGFAQFGGMGGGMGRPFQTWLVKIETINDKTVSGSLTLFSLPVECDLGVYHLKPEKIKALRFTRPGEKPVARPRPPGVFVSNPNGGFAQGFYGVSVSTTTSEEIAGDLYVADWELKTDLGTITLDASKLKSLTFMGLAPDVERTPPTEAK